MRERFNVADLETDGVLDDALLTAMVCGIMVTAAKLGKDFSVLLADAAELMKLSYHADGAVK